MSKNNINELQVVFNNKFNEVTIKDLTEREHNLLMGFVGRIKNMGEKELTLSYDEASELCGREYIPPKELEGITMSLWGKIKNTDYSWENNKNSGGAMLLFSSVVYDRDKDEISLLMNPHLLYIVNDFEKNGNYTSVEFKKFLDTSDSYSKRLFRLLSQYSKTGYYKVDTNKFREIMECPTAYNVGKFNQKIVNPSIEDLKKYFPGLTLNKITKGKKIKYYEFTFQKQTKVREWDPNKYKKGSSTSRVKEVGPRGLEPLTPEQEQEVQDLYK